MANQNNLLRPPILNLEQPVIPAIENIEQQLIEENSRHRQRQELFQQNRNMEQEQLQTTIRQVLAEQFPTLLLKAQNPTHDFTNAENQEILPQFRANLADLDKIPDIVKSLREFSGNPAEFSSWKKGIDRILKTYEHTVGTPKYFGILHTIRNKITGNADTALESYNVPLNWNAISKCLTLHYADKRDLGTLEYQMTTITQAANQTVEEFHQAVYKHLSLILNKIGCMELCAESEQLMTKLYRDKALDTFVRGLRGDLPRLLGIKEPTDLPSALHLCLKLENQAYRTNHATIKGQPIAHRNTPPKHITVPQQTHFQQNPNFQQRPMVPPKNQYAMIRPNNNFGQPPTRPFFPQTAQNTNPQFLMYQPIPQPLPRPLAAKPQPKPEPMDVDRSIQTRQINYMNRPPQMEVGKRPPALSTTQNDANKRQRNFNIQTSTDEQTDTDYSNSTLDEYEQLIASQDEQQDQEESLTDYTERVEENDQEYQYDYTYLNFLE